MRSSQLFLIASVAMAVTASPLVNQRRQDFDLTGDHFCVYSNGPNPTLNVIESDLQCPPVQGGDYGDSNVAANQAAVDASGSDRESGSDSGSDDNTESAASGASTDSAAGPTASGSGRQITISQSTGAISVDGVPCHFNADGSAVSGSTPGCVREQGDNKNIQSSKSAGLGFGGATPTASAASKTASATSTATSTSLKSASPSVSSLPPATQTGAAGSLHPSLGYALVGTIGLAVLLV